jgi:plasmid maintenance system killer protein
MEKDSRLIYAVFHDEANKVFFSLLHEFQRQIDLIDRIRNENVFQMQKGKYLSILKKSLEQIALQIINRYKEVEYPDRLRMKLTEGISYYMKEFSRQSGLA